MKYVTRNSTMIEAYHTKRDCARLQKGDKILEISDDHRLVDELTCCNECNETVEYYSGGTNGLLHKIQWLERKLGKDIEPDDYLPLDQHQEECKDSDCPVCLDLQKGVKYAEC